MNRKNVSPRHVIGFALLLLLLGILAPLAWGSTEATFDVNMESDGADAAIGDGQCDTDAGAPGMQCTLRAAVQEANATPGLDTITLPAGTYQLTIAGANEDNAATGDLDVTAPLTLNGAGADSAIIDGNGAATDDRVFDFYADAVVTGVTIRNGRALTGGGLSNVAVLTLSDSVVTANESVHDSGGVFNGGTLTIAGSQVSDNVAGATGGGVYNVHRLTVVNSTISDNTAATEAGGLYNLFLTSVMTITNSTLRDNEAGAGGAIYNNGGLVTVYGSTLNGNKAVALHGGGVYNVGDLYFNDSTMSNNRAANFGGGVFSEPAGVTQFNSATVAFNQADDDGDGIGDGGGVYNNGGSMYLRNSILYGNEVRIFPIDAKDDCGGTVTSLSYNWVFSLRSCTLSGGSADVIGLNPALGPLQDNGGPTQTHALLSGSPAIDSGPSTYCRDHHSEIFEFDQRGFARHVDGNSTGTSYCDPGAYEFAITYELYIPLVTK